MNSTGSYRGLTLTLVYKRVTQQDEFSSSSGVNKAVSQKSFNTPKMMTFTVHTLAIIFGILGNAVAIGVFLAPLSTFYRIFKKKSSEGYQVIPYSVALFSAMMLLYYASLKTDGILLITINSFGCAIEVLYLVMYLVYAPKQTKGFTLKLLLLFNCGICGLVVLLTMFLAKGSKRTAIVGWINAVINICVFAAPLSIMRQVIRTKSVEFMPIFLSLSLTLNATMWFFYGFFIKDYYIAVPNILGFVLGTAQMLLFLVYKSCTSTVEQDSSQQKTNTESKLSSMTSAHEDNQLTEVKIGE